jgi:membrane-bound serine protease (ClpP class)
MLVEGPIPELRVPLEFVLPLAVGITLVCAFVVRFVIRAHRSRVASGREGLTGEIGTVSQELAPEGKVFVHGEIWNAMTAEDPIPEGARVRVVRVDEMTLTVEPAATGSSSGGGETAQ